MTDSRERLPWLIGLAITLMVAGGLSYAASIHPDGLEWVAERLGFASAATGSPAEASPLADYAVVGLQSPLLSNALAGVAGALMVLGLTVALFYALRHRTDQPV